MKSNTSVVIQGSILKERKNLSKKNDNSRYLLITNYKWVHCTEKGGLSCPAYCILNHIGGAH